MELPQGIKSPWIKRLPLRSPDCSFGQGWYGHQLSMIWVDERRTILFLTVPDEYNGAEDYFYHRPTIGLGGGGGVQEQNGTKTQLGSVYPR